MRYLFGAFEFSGTDGHIYRNGTPVRVRPKLVKLLRYLIDHRGRLVTKRELLGHLWPDVRVGNTSLSTLLNEARHLLGDSGEQQKIIRTESRRGYSFIADVAIQPSRARGKSTRDLNRYDKNHTLDLWDRALYANARGESTRQFLIETESDSGSLPFVEDLLDMASERGLDFHRAFCPPPPNDRFLSPWRTLLRSIRESSASESSPPPFPALLQNFMSAPDPPLDPDLKEMTASLGLPLHSRRTREALSEGIHRWTTQIESTVFLIEDLHWADPASFDMLERLTRSVKGTCPPLMLLTSHPAHSVGPEWRRTRLLRMLESASTQTFVLSDTETGPRMRPQWNETDKSLHRTLQSTLRVGQSAIQNGDLSTAKRCLDSALKISHAASEDPFWPCHRSD